MIAAKLVLASPPASPGKASPPQLPSPPTPAPVEAPGDTPVVSAEGNAANPLPIPPLSPSPNDPATPPSNSQGLGAIVAGAFGITPTPLPGDEDIKPTPGPTPIISYSISIAPSASAVIVNGVTSVLPTEGSSEPVLAGPLPITVGSQPVTQNAASQYVVDGQTLTPGAPPINLQGTEVSLAPSASAIVIAGSTIVLSSAGAPAFTVGVETFTADDASQYAAGGQTLTPGGPAVTISGTRLSLAPGGTQVVVGSSTIGIIPTFTPPSLPLLPLTLGSQTYTADSNYHYTIASQTLTPGGPAVTISGTRVSLAPGGTEAVVGGSTIELTPTFTPSSPVPILTLGSQTYTAESNSAYIIDGQILIPGGSAITVSGTRLSLAPSATQFIIGSSAIILSPGITPPPITFDSQTFTANALSSYIIDSQTLIPGGPAITISGTRLSLAADGLNAIVGTSTSTLLPSPRPTFPPLTIASHLITANPLGLYIIGSQTLTPGGPAITISGTRLSVAADGLSAIVGTSTSLLLPLSLPFSGPTRNPPPLTIASHLITANAAGLYIIGTQTLIPGSSGIVIPASAFPPKSVFTIGSQTFTANPTAFSIDGTEISAGGAGVTIAGTGVRLGGGGLLVVGNGSVVLGAGVGGSGSGGVRNSGIGVGAFKGEARRGRGGRGGGLLVMLMMVVGLLGVGLLG